MGTSRLMRALTMVLALMVSIGSVGCANTANASSDAETAVYDQFGERGDDTVDVLVTNGLDGEVTGISARATGTEEWTRLKASPAVAADGDDAVGSSADVSLASGKTAELHVDPVLATSYDLLVDYVTKGDAQTVELWSVDLTGMSELTVRMTDDGVGYVDYVLADGTEGSTRDAAVAKAEADRRAEEEARAQEQRRAEEEAAAAAQAEAEAQAQAEAEAAAAEAAAAASDQQQGYESYSYSDAGSSSYVDTGSSYADTGSSYTAPVTTTQDCTADVIAFD